MTTLSVNSHAHQPTLQALPASALLDRLASFSTNHVQGLNALAGNSSVTSLLTAALEDVISPTRQTHRNVPHSAEQHNPIETLFSQWESKDFADLEQAINEHAGTDNSFSREEFEQFATTVLGLERSTASSIFDALAQMDTKGQCPFSNALHTRTDA